MRFLLTFTNIVESVVKWYVCQRVMEMAQYLRCNKCTIRQVAQVFCVSKSTAHKDLSVRLPLVDKRLYESILPILQQNWESRHLRGGIATRNKWQLQRFEKEK